MKPKRPPLIPPDRERCQCEERVGSFMSFGLPQMVRCQNKPTFIATENAPSSDGRRGSMSLCAHHAKVMMQVKEGEATLKRI